MKKHRMLKALALTLAIILVAGLAAACGGGSDSGGGGDTKTQAPAATVKPADSGTTTSPVDDPGSIAVQETFKDMGGAVIKHVGWPGTGHIPAPLGEPEPDPDMVENYGNAMLQWQRQQDVYKNFNIGSFEITEIGFGDYVEVLTTGVMSNDPPGDWLWLDGQWMLDIIVGNLIVPFNDFMPADHDMFHAQEYTHARSVFQKKVWTIAMQSASEGGAMMGINLNILNALGLENPVDLYERKDGSWNYEKLVEMARIATRDTDGDGIIDQYGIGGQPGDVVRAMVGTSGQTMCTQDTYMFNFDQPEILRILEYVYQMYGVDKSNKYDPDSGRPFWDWSPNYYGFKEGNVLFWCVHHWALALWVRDEEPAFEFTWVPWPLGPDNKDGLYNNVGLGTGYAPIRNSSVAPKDLYDIWFWWQNWYEYDKELRDEAGAEWIMLPFKTAAEYQRFKEWTAIPGRPDVSVSLQYEGVGYSWICDGFPEMFYFGTHTPASYMEAERPNRQNMLDQILGRFR